MLAERCSCLPAALIQTRPDGMDVVPMEQQLPGQRDLAAGTTRRATAAWWQDGHPGWMIFTLGGTHFDSLEQVIQVCLRRQVLPSLQAGSITLDTLLSPTLAPWCICVLLLRAPANAGAPG